MNVLCFRPAGKNIEWFYNEVAVPSCNDAIGSYFMVNGFAEGYCGIQVNSATEDRVLFSVWSPFTTDDPKSMFKRSLGSKKPVINFAQLPK